MSVADLSTENPKSFFSYVNSRKPVRSKIAQLKDSQGVLKTDNEVKANIFNEYFASVFTKENDSILDPKIVLNTIVCNYEDKEKGLDKLNNFKVQGQIT